MPGYSKTITMGEGKSSVASFQLAYTDINMVSRSGVVYEKIGILDPFTPGETEWKQGIGDRSVGRINFDQPAGPGGEIIHIIYKR